MSATRVFVFGERILIRNVAIHKKAHTLTKSRQAMIIQYQLYQLKCIRTALNWMDREKERSV